MTKGKKQHKQKKMVRTCECKQSRLPRVAPRNTDPSARLSNYCIACVKFVLTPYVWVMEQDFINTFMGVEKESLEFGLLWVV